MSLDALRERVHAPEGGREDLDALLVEIDRPLGAGENARHRAVQLRRIVEDSWLAGFTGSDGRRTDEAATQALRTLAESSAGALSSEEVLQPVPSTPTEEEGLSWRHVVAVIALAMGLFEASVMFGAFALVGPLLALFFTVPTVIWPALVLMSRPGAHNRLSYALSATLSACSIVPLVLVPWALLSVLKALFSLRNEEAIQTGVFTFVLVRGALVAFMFIACLGNEEPTSSGPPRK